MKPFEHEGPKGQVHLEGLPGTPLFFSQLSDLVPCLRLPEQSNTVLATSAPLGMTFGGDSRSSHILDPRRGKPVEARWPSISIPARRTALADALSTVACLAKDRAEFDAMCRAFAGVSVEAAWLA